MDVVMADYLFKRTLPPPNAADWSMTVASGIRRTRFESGHVRQRRAFTHRPFTLSLSWDFDSSDLSRFAAFALDRGYGWFDLDIPVPSRPDLLSAARIRFTSDYTVAVIGYDWLRVSVSAEAEAMPDPAAATKSLLTGIGNAPLFRGW
jgi:hypothetical protein